LVVGSSRKVCKDEFLERFDLVLEVHQVRNSFVSSKRGLISGTEYIKKLCLSPLVGIVNILKTDIFLVLEESVEFGMMPVKPKLGQDK
jgi:hypothetical protein